MCQGGASGTACVGCLGGWEGDQCDQISGALSALVFGLLGSFILLGAVVFVAVKRKWPPFQERNPYLLIATGLSGAAWCVCAPAAANPRLFGVPLELEGIELEQDLGWHLLFPFGAGYGVWAGCLYIRYKNLV
eukprot:SAG22_NODE_13721_length_397_cov_0.523490_1_plen_132_part_11